MSGINSKEAQRLAGELLSDDAPCEATSDHALRTQVMDSRIAKNEREWWARRTIAELEATIADKDRVIEAVMEELKGQARYDCRVTNACAKRCIDALAALLEKNDE